jgi:opacity protein-like surface antigen
MMTAIPARIALMLSALLCSLTIKAESYDAALGFYGEVGIGVSRFALESQLQDSLPDAITSGDERDSAFSAALGYQWTPWFAVELGYVDLGEVRLQAQSTLPRFDLRSTAETELLAAMLKFTQPIAENISVYGKLGAARYDLALQTELVDSLQSLQAREDESDTEFAWGLGVEYQFSPRLRIGLGYLQSKAGDRLITQETLQSAQLSLGYTF